MEIAGNAWDSMVFINLLLFVMSWPVFWMSGPGFLLVFVFLLVSGPIQNDARQENMDFGGTQTSRSFTRTRLVTKTMDGPSEPPQMSIQLMLISLLAVPRQYVCGLQVPSNLFWDSTSTDWTSGLHSGGLHLRAYNWGPTGSRQPNLGVR